MAIRDGDWTLYDHDFRTGRTVWHHFDGDLDHWRVDYPVDSVLKGNGEALNDSHGQRWGEGRRVASIPMNIFHSELSEAVAQDDQRYISRWLNDADRRAWRTFGGNV